MGQRKGKRRNRSEMNSSEVKQQLSGRLRSIVNTCTYILSSLLHCASVLLGTAATQIYLDFFSRNQIFAEDRYAAGASFSCLRPA